MTQKREQLYFSAKVAPRREEQIRWTIRLREMTGSWLFSDLSRLDGSGFFRGFTNLSLAARAFRPRSTSFEKVAVGSRLRPIASARWGTPGMQAAPNSEFFKFKKNSLFLNRLSQLFLINSAAEVGFFLKWWWLKLGLVFAIVFFIISVVAFGWADVLLSVVTKASMLYFDDFFFYYFDYCYLSGGLFTKALQLNELVVLGVANHVIANFHLQTITSAFLFQDFELVISYAEPFWLLFYSDPLTLANYPLLLFALSFISVGLLVVSLKAFSAAAFLRSDLWRLLISLSHHSSWLRRLHSAEALNQALGGKLMALIGERDQVFNGDFKNFYTFNQNTGITSAARPYFEYFFAKTVGGAIGFKDLFPSISAYHNAEFGWRSKLKVFLLFRKVRWVLLKKTSVTWRASATQAAMRWWQPSIKFFGKLRTLQLIPTFLGPQTYFDFALLGFLRRLWDTCCNVSRGGDASVLKLRQYFFKVVAEDRDPWNLFDRANSKGGKRERVAINPQKVNWYGRELNTFVMSNVLRTRFTIPALQKFSFKLHNQINDYSFWTPELNLSGQNAYSSKWDAFRVDNLFDFNELRASRFGVFEALESEEEDDSQLDYVDDDLEVFFDDNLLHKDFELIFFDHEFDDIVVRGRSDELIEDLTALPKLKAILTNESIIYGAGQEGDYAIKTSPNAYAGLHAAEHVLEGEYRRELTDSVYNDVSDYLALNSSEVIPHIFNIPEGRAFFYWDNMVVAESLEVSERARLGRVIYFYWRLISKFFAANYYKQWLPVYVLFFISAIAWFLLLFWLMLTPVITAQPGLPLAVDALWIVLFFFFIVLFTVFIFGGEARFFIVARLKRHALLSLLLLEPAVWLNLIGLSFLLREVRFDKAQLLNNFFLKYLGSGPALCDVNGGKYLAGGSGATLLSHFFGRDLYSKAVLRVSGMSELTLWKKLMGRAEPLGEVFAFGYNPPIFDKSNACVRPVVNLGMGVWQKRTVNASSTSAIYHELNAAGGLTSECATAVIPATNIVLYDFDWRGALSFNAAVAAGLFRANFVSGILIQSPIRQLQQHRSLTSSVTAVSDATMNPIQSQFAERALRARIGALTTAPHFLSDLLFDALDGGAAHGGRSDTWPEVARQSPSRQVREVVRLSGVVADLPRTSARSRFRNLRFLEDDLSRDVSHVTQNVRENFLRLFLSKSALREVYAGRSKSSNTAPSKWSYTSQVKWTIYATPLHGTKNGI